MLLEINISECLLQVDIRDILSEAKAYFSEKDPNIINSLSLGNLKILSFIYANNFRSHLVREIFNTINHVKLKNENNVEYISLMELIEIYNFKEKMNIIVNEYVKKIFDFRSEIKINLDNTNRLISNLSF